MQRRVELLDSYELAKFQSTAQVLELTRCAWHEQNSMWRRLFLMCVRDSARPQIWRVVLLELLARASS